MTNGNGLLLPTGNSQSPFYLAWSNVVAGNYALTAVATGQHREYGYLDGGQHQCHKPAVHAAAGAVHDQLLVSDQRRGLFGSGDHRPARAGNRFRNVVETVQYFSGATSLGIVTNTKGVLPTNTTSDSPFYLAWSNVVAGNYALTVVATDSIGNMVTSAVVNISVTNRLPPPPVPFTIGLVRYPTNGEAFLAPANVEIYAAVTDSTVVQTVQFSLWRREHRDCHQYERRVVEWQY